MIPRIITTSAALAVVLPLVGIGAAEARTPAKADLTISKGSATQRGSTVTVSLTETNARGRRGKAAPRSTTTLRAVAGNRSIVLGRVAVPKLGRGAHKRLRATVSTKHLAAGRWSLRACADSGSKVHERSERNNCRTLGTVKGTAPAPKPSNPATTLVTFCKGIDCAPVTVAEDGAGTWTDASGTYWSYVPSAYGNGTGDPWRVLIWLHGCGGTHDDLWGAADYWGYHYLVVTPNGAEGGCWNMTTGVTRVLNTVASVEAHFNVDPKRIILGGYSSGGDLAYRAGILHANLFAGILAHNTSPFRDNGLTQTDVDHAAWKLNVFHLLSENDQTYPEAGVNAELDQLVDKGFPVERETVPGAHHWDDPDNDTDPTSGTWYDFQHRLIEAHMDNDWVAP